MKSKRTLENLRKSLPGKVYMYLKDEDTMKAFLADAKNEGYSFGKMGLPEIILDSIISLKENKQLCYVGVIGRLEFQCNGGDNAGWGFHRIDYAEYISGSEDYSFKNDTLISI
ncbi:MAG: hypothetical protein K6F76_05820 [Clostridiales bacterium]|nr:hypothetical protein [Clostridiales bacterium]